MKICTYNIWDSNTDFDIRLELLIKELKRLDVDLIALQEVRDEETFNTIKTKLNFKTGYYFEGLVILSNLDIKLHSTYGENNNYMLRVIYENTSFTTVHFDWEKKDIRMKGLDQYFNMLETMSVDNEFLLGDFNESSEDNIHYELIMNDFIDLHKNYSHRVNEYPLATLDMEHNPRWRNMDTEEEPSRVDWIMLYTSNECTINNVELIGTKEEKAVTPSDHYGVTADIEIKL